MGATKNIVGQSGEKGRRAAQILEGWRYPLNGESAGTHQILIDPEVTETAERLRLQLHKCVPESHGNGLPFTLI